MAEIKKIDLPKWLGKKTRSVELKVYTIAQQKQKSAAAITEKKTSRAMYH